MKMKPLVILTGPTAVGKTDLSIRLAKEIGGEIISADSMQVYRKMNIGTAKIRPEEMQGVPHHLIDIVEPGEEFNVVLFQRYALAAMEEIYSRGNIPILVGGTGFYIQAVLYQIRFTENNADDSYRKELQALADEKGAEYLYEMLKQTDEKAAEAIHANNVKRIIRALEFYKKTGTQISTHNEEERHRQSPYQFCYFVLNDDRKRIYQNIDRRVDRMLEKGLVDEVRELQAEGYTRDMVSMQGLGYKEILDYLNGTLTLEEAVYILKRDTRHFAKRQITWFKREKEVIWLNREEIGSDDAILRHMLAILKTKGIIET